MPTPKTSPLTKPIGIFDIGSNSVRFVVFDPPYLHAPPSFNEKVQCSLGRDLDETGLLYPEGKRCTLRALKGFKSLAGAMNLRGLHAIGTAALRDAADGIEFRDEIKAKTGINIRIISGEEEARLAARGVLTAWPDAIGLAGDLGGGSLELASLKDGDILSPISLPLGVLRICAQANPAAYIESHLAALPEILKRQNNFYVMGGTWRALAGLHMQDQGLLNGRLAGYKINREDMQNFADRLLKTSLEDIRARFTIEEKRAVLIPSACLLMKKLLEHCTFETLTVSTTGLRDGLLSQIVESY